MLLKYPGILSVFICGCVVSIGIFACELAYAAVTSYTDNESGLVCRDMGDGLEVDFFTNYSLGTGGTYVFNEAGGTLTATGRIDIKDFTDVRAIGVWITNTDSGTITLRINGTVGSATNNILISDTLFSGTSSGAVSVPNYLTKIQCGLIKTGTTTGSADVFGIFRDR